jgi:hypothetical protein
MNSKKCFEWIKKMSFYKEMMINWMRGENRNKKGVTGMG